MFRNGGEAIIFNKNNGANRNYQPGAFDFVED